MGVDMISSQEIMDHVAEKNICHLLWSNNYERIDELRRLVNKSCLDYEEDELLRAAYDLNDICLEDLRLNLDIELDMPIIILGNIGRWNGRVLGFKDLKENLEDCFYTEDDYIKWYLDEKGDLRGTGYHHDGTNYYLYRVFKKNVSEDQIENFKSKVLNWGLSYDDSKRYTQRLGDKISEVYGFDLKVNE